MFIDSEMLDPFSRVWSQLRVKKDNIWTDNWIYLLHRKWSFTISLIGLLSFLTYSASLGDPIRCLRVGQSKKEIPLSYVEVYCWAWGTYIIPEYLATPVGDNWRLNVPHPGIGIEIPGETTRIYHSHHLFYPTIILFQCCCFRFSKCLWQHFEGGRLKTLISELASPTISMEKMSKRVCLVTDYLTTYPITFFTEYSCKYIFCEIFNFVNTILQFFILDEVLHRNFLTYGVDVIHYMNQDNPEAPSPYDTMFPKVTICKFNLSGPGGSDIPIEALCVLPLHSFAEKIFLISWFWFVILGTVSLFGLVYRLLVLCSVTCRYIILRLKTSGSLCDPRWIRYFVKHSSYGTWFVVSLLEKNMSPWVFAHLMRELHDKMREVTDKNL